MYVLVLKNITEVKPKNNNKNTDFLQTLMDGLNSRMQRTKGRINELKDRKIATCHSD